MTNTLPAQLPHRLERSILIRARRDVVFRFFTDSERWARWWGAGSTIDPRPGGRVLIRFPGNTEVLGEVLEIVDGTRLVFTYGFASGTPIPAGSSRVTLRLDAEPSGTRVTVDHEFDDAKVCEEHVQGWRFQLSLFANVVSDEVHGNAAATIDAWFRAWDDADASARATGFAGIATPAIEFRDRFSMLAGMDDLLAHVEAGKRFMPGIRLEQRGPVRHCQGTVLADWVALDPSGAERVGGTNVFVLDADGRIESVIGIHNASSSRA